MIFSIVLGILQLIGIFALVLFGHEILAIGWCIGFMLGSIDRLLMNRNQ